MSSFIFIMSLEYAARFVKLTFSVMHSIPEPFAMPTAPSAVICWHAQSFTPTSPLTSYFLEFITVTYRSSNTPCTETLSPSDSSSAFIVSSNGSSPSWLSNEYPSRSVWYRMA